MAVLGRIVSLALGLIVLWRHGHYFRTRRSWMAFFRYLAIAASIPANIFLGAALAMYVWGGLNNYLPIKLEFVFACGHFCAAITPALWHGITYAELGRDKPCGAA